jgi:hypothetical protein
MYDSYLLIEIRQKFARQMLNLHEISYTYSCEKALKYLDLTAK